MSCLGLLSYWVAGSMFMARKAYRMLIQKTCTFQSSTTYYIYYHLGLLSYWVRAFMFRTRKAYWRLIQ